MISHRGKVMFIDTVHPVLQEVLESIGYNCEDFTTKSTDEITTYIPNFQGVVIRSKFKLTKELMIKATNLKFIARSGSGLENIDVDFASQKNIQCFNSPEGNKDALGEHCVGMLLSLFNNINLSHQQVSAGVWLREANRGVELKGKTVGLIGYGVMGKSFAEKLSGFGARVIAFDNNKTDFSSSIVEEVSMRVIYEQSDVISLHVNYVDENYHMINQDFINAFIKNIYIINSARGKCLDTEHLITALKTGKVLGACLDVLEIETTDFQINETANKILKELSEFKQVLLSPHVGGWTTESYFKLSKVLGDKIKRFSQD
jgi:D-3-phosphoglycerate dehydrogenase